jgi:hypothetical protein
VSPFILLFFELVFIKYGDNSNNATEFDCVLGVLMS